MSKELDQARAEVAQILHYQERKIQRSERDIRIDIYGEVIAVLQAKLDELTRQADAWEKDSIAQRYDHDTLD